MEKLKMSPSTLVYALLIFSVLNYLNQLSSAQDSVRDQVRTQKNPSCNRIFSLHPFVKNVIKQRAKLVKRINSGRHLKDENRMEMIDRILILGLDGGLNIYAYFNNNSFRLEEIDSLGFFHFPRSFNVMYYRDQFHNGFISDERYIFELKRVEQRWKNFFQLGLKESAHRKAFRLLLRAFVRYHSELFFKNFFRVFDYSGFSSLSKSEIRTGRNLLEKILNNEFDVYPFEIRIRVFFELLLINTMERSAWEKEFSFSEPKALDEFNPLTRDLNRLIKLFNEEEITFFFNNPDTFISDDDFLYALKMKLFNLLKEEYSRL